MAARDDDPGHPCSRAPSEFCDGARIIWLDDGTSRREPALTPRAFCEPCRSRIITCLEELPAAYLRLGFALGDAPKTGAAVRAPFGPSEPVRPEVDALMRSTAVLLGGWEARVRKVARLSRDDGAPPGSPQAVRDAAATLRAHIDVLLALQPGWMTRTYTFPPGKPGSAPAQEGTCGRCGLRVGRIVGRRIDQGRPPRWYVIEMTGAPVPACAHEPRGITSSRALSLIPPDIEAEIGGEEIVTSGDGWVQVTRHVGATAAGNEVIGLHHRARRALGETRPQPEYFDGIPCRACEEMALERAEPPSDPSAEAKHSRCAACRDEMTREEFAQHAGRYASWARGAGIQVCRRCSLAAAAATAEQEAALHAGCCWHACSCQDAPHPRRRAAA